MRKLRLHIEESEGCVADGVEGGERLETEKAITRMKKWVKE